MPSGYDAWDAIPFPPEPRMRRCLLLAVALAAASCGAPQASPPAKRAPSAADLALTFVDLRGETVDLKSYRGKKAVMLVVTRGLPESPGGVFCPACVAQVSGLAANHAAFEERGAVVLVVFPGPSERAGEFIRQAKGREDGFPFPLLLDKDAAISARLGIRGDIAKPSTFILDRKGNVVYAYVGETVTDRPSLKAVLGQLDRLSPKP